MRTTAVPAQVTTVEDKIAGSLGFSQLLLLITPIFGGSALFAILPPFFSYSVYKAALIVLVAAVCCVLAIRFKGKILLSWATVLLKYNSRPTYYVFNKNCLHGRERYAISSTKEAAEPSHAKSSPEVTHRVDDNALFDGQQLLTDPTANVHFTTTKKGELRVHLTKIPHESLS